jgi:type IV secretion system protein TrbJ
MLRIALHSRAIALAAALLAGAMTVPAQAQITVFDPSNYSQTMLTAARTLQQVNNQIQALQNQASMLRNMDRNLLTAPFPEVQQLVDRMQQIDTLLQQVQGIQFDRAQVEQQFRAMFPDFDTQVRADAHAVEAKARLDAAMAGFQHTMTVQAEVAQGVAADARALADLSQRSQSAQGALQVGQATNQLLALSAKQQLSIQQMLAAQFRAQAFEQARAAQAALDGRAATKKFLGAGTAYTPR